MKQLLLISLLFVGVFSYRVPRNTNDGLSELKISAAQFKDMVAESGMELVKEHCWNNSKSDAAFQKLTGGTETLLECLDGVFEFSKNAEKFNETEKLADVSNDAIEELFVEYCPKIGQGLDCLNNFVTNSAKDCLDSDEYEFATEFIKFINTTTSFVCYNKGERVMTILNESDEMETCFENVDLQTEMQACGDTAEILKSFYDDTVTLSDEEECDVFDKFTKCTTDLMKTNCPGRKTPRIVGDYFDVVRVNHFNCTTNEIHE